MMKKNIRSKVKIKKRKVYKAHPTKIVYGFWQLLVSNTGAFFLGITAMMIGYYQFYISRPIIKYTSSTSQVSSFLDDDSLKVMIKGKEYPEVYKTTIMVSNFGQEALSGSDVSQSDPVRVYIPAQVEVLHYNINRKMTSYDVKVDLSPKEKDIVITFNYLNPDNQIAVDLFSPQDFSDYKVIGSAANVENIEEAWSSQQVERFIVVIGVIILFLLFLLFKFYLYQKRRRYHI